MAYWGYRISPVVGIDRPLLMKTRHQAIARSSRRSPSAATESSLHNGINLDVSRMERLIKDEHAFAQQMRAFFEKQQIAVRLAIAPTLGCAWALSRYGPEPLLIAHQETFRDTIAALPIEALRLEKEIQYSLHELHLRSIRQLLAIPRKSLASRFGQTLPRTLELLLGEQEEPIAAEHFEPPLRLEQEFLEPLSQYESLQAAVQLLFRRVIEGFQNLKRAIAQFALIVHTLGQAPQEKLFVLSLPTVDEHHLWPMITRYLESCSMGLGVTQIIFHVTHWEAQSYSNRNALEEESANQRQRQLATLADSFSEKLGRYGALQVEHSETHVPERVMRYRALSPRPLPSSPVFARSARNDDQRPSLLFRPPKPVRAIAELPDAIPKWIRWKHSNHLITLGVGPERIMPEWWTEPSELFRTRDYFRVQLQGGMWAWIFREVKTNRWFLHGVWA